MKRPLLILAAVLAAFLASVAVLAPSAPATTSSWPPPIALCFGDHGVEFGTTHAALCLHEIGGGPSGGLYFTPSVDTGLNGANPSGQMVWMKLHAADNAYYAWENYSEPWGGSTPRANGRIIALDEGPKGQCILVWPSWTATPTECFLVSDGGAVVAAPHPLDATERFSVAQYQANARAAIPLEYR